MSKTLVLIENQPELINNPEMRSQSFDPFWRRGVTDRRVCVCTQMKGINLTEADWKQWLPKIVKINSVKNPKTIQ